MTSEEAHALVVAAYHDRVVPMPSHVAVVFTRAVTLAREAGVSFRPAEVAVYTYAGRWRESEREPSVCFFTDRPVLIYVNINLPLGSARAWCWHILHEFSHAYFDARHDVGFWQREDRADAFADRAMAGWRWW